MAAWRMLYAARRCILARRPEAAGHAAQLTRPRARAALLWTASTSAPPALTTSPTWTSTWSSAWTHRRLSGVAQWHVGSATSTHPCPSASRHASSMPGPPSSSPPPAPPSPSPPSSASPAPPGWATVLDWTLGAAETDRRKLQLLERELRRHVAAADAADSAAAFWDDRTSTAPLTRAYYLRQLAQLHARERIAAAWPAHVAVASSPTPLDAPATWAALLDGLLDMAAWHDAAGAHREPVDAWLASAADRARALLPAGYLDGGPAAWTPALNAVVFQQDGFALNRGVPDDRSSFYDPRNSFLPSVVARRLGNQISLCVLYGAVAARLGLSVTLANVPYHVMLRSGTMFIDVTNGGVLQTEAGLASLLAPTATATATAARTDESSGPSETISVASMSVRDVFQRVVMNMLSAFQRQGRYEPAVLDHLDLALLVCPSRHLHATRLQTLVYFMMHDPINYDDYNARAEVDVSTLRDALRRANTSPTSRFTDAVAAYEGLLTQLARVRAFHNRGKPTPPRTRKGDEDARFLTLGTVVRHARLPAMRGVVVAWRRARDVAGWGTVDVDGPASATTLTDQPTYDILCDNGTRRTWPASLTVVATPGEASTTPEPPGQHPDLGRYFGAFRNGRYTVNAWVCASYPDL